MSPGIIYCFDDQDAQEAAETMGEKQIRRLPVLDRNKQLVGIVSLGDLAVEARDDRMSGDALKHISEPKMAGGAAGATAAWPAAVVHRRQQGEGANDSQTQIRRVSPLLAEAEPKDRQAAEPGDVLDAGSRRAARTGRAVLQTPVMTGRDRAIQADSGTGR